MLDDKDHFLPDFPFFTDNKFYNISITAQEIFKLIFKKATSLDKIPVVVLQSWQNCLTMPEKEMFPKSMEGVNCVTLFLKCR